ncbi:FtsX-like permease family protein [Kroppenstedtia pulmonis]|uniref:FtsX-like permease family protein n=1 Tax=Kroppenstedtia pulmonis TaxID=1380685 RepID=A0A7D4BIQ3_9BACL|nr:ABC transporter permease [Kroppenstedtia pulmonis]QKG85635.1 FtsX-like permease family protein [Kroppenstedtia pulmonis]
MTLLDNFKMALDSIRAHKMRAVLTILGIVIGVASVLIIVAIGQGGTEELTKSLAGVGNTVQVMASEEAMTKHAGGVPPDFFTEEDVRDLANLPGVKQVTSSSYDMLDVGYRKKESEGALVTGVNHNSFDQKVAQGRDFQTADFLRGHSGAVINDKMKQELFSKENPVGKIVRVGSQPVEVIGVLEGSQGMAASFDQATVYLPYQTWRSVLGKSQINQLTIQVESADRIKEVGDASIQTLERNHQTKGEYEVINMDQLVKGNNQIADIMTVVIGSIGGISLLVGGIGVMNIMLVSVTERTREIGIRMSLGATRNQIMTQFLIESVTLSIFGGVAGVLLGFGVIGLLALLSPLPAVISPMVTLGTLLFSGLFGVIFGLLPANKASRLNPIECLRYE